MQSKIIGKIAATENRPTTIDEFYFWTSKNLILNPFDVIKVNHINDSTTYGVVEEISHITDTPSYLTSYISNDFGDVEAITNTERIGMNYIKAKVVGNSKNIYIPVTNGSQVSMADRNEVEKALGLDNVKNPLVCGYIQMYESADDQNRVTLPISLNSDFLIGPEGAHLNISGISGLAAKTSYAMFILKAIQEKYSMNDTENDGIAFIFLNVKGRDLLAIDEPNLDLDNSDQSLYEMLGLSHEPFKNVKYLYPYSTNNYSNTYASKDLIESQISRNKVSFYKYIYEYDKDSLDLLFSNIDDPAQTMDSIINYIISAQGNFGNIKTWENFRNEIDEYCKAGNSKTDKEISIASWRKFKRIISKSTKNPIFSQRTVEEKNETRIQDSIMNIKKNDVYVIDIAKLEETMQSFVFGDVIRNVYDLKLGQTQRDENDIPSKIIIFIDELNKYASSDIPKNSPILRQLIDIAERGRSLGIILFSAEQFRSVIYDRVTGNCSTHAYGRTNAIEISKKDYQFIPNVYKNMMTRLKQGEYIIQNPIFRSVLKIKFPKPVYKQFK
ncbi:MAG TPA: ATP-binding protein [Bacteroidota bacterium]|nr:ATP-binding protein [Bacteroidota bacterium]